ncbi:NUDIX hydrolase [Tenggerimyces flavus]|uniref:NUDIX domain-containing protein n=1 Tax=Tenggerimyces flavus TaxID=1708749 RepID=A0ABV7YJD0_9ACTN|nr:NUDIX hydrolase [Tenggerimyces flavus]MBM7783873.1 8-oxo-dGTP diphosphatase [Tenggerimyces flavus]
MNTEVLAAGAVVWRRTAMGEVEVALIHRPKYDDWSFPKGKLKPGESLAAAAVREVHEETTIAIRLGVPLPPVSYPLSNGTRKVVHYWAGLPVSTSSFVASEEVDRREFVPLGHARRRLTHAHDAALLDAFSPLVTTPLVVLRHAKASARVEWPGADVDRPLSPVGEEQALRLVELFASYGISRVVSSDALRCLETVRPYASSLGLSIETEPAFSEDASLAVTRERASILLDSVRPTLVCSHRPVLPTLFETLGIEPVALPPASLVVIHRAGRTNVATELHEA